MGTVQLDAVIACFVEVFCGVGETIDYALDLFGRSGVWLLKGHAHDIAFELDIAGGNGVLLNAGFDLSARVRHLANDQAAMLPALGGEFGKGVETLAGEGGSAGNDWVASCSS